MAHSRVRCDGEQAIAHGKGHRTDGRLGGYRAHALSRLHLPQLDRVVGRAGGHQLRVGRNVQSPYGTSMAVQSTQAFAVCAPPHTDGGIFRRCEKQISLPIILYLGQRTSVRLQKNGNHFSSFSSYSTPANILPFVLQSTFCTRNVN